MVQDRSPFIVQEKPETMDVETVDRSVAGTSDLVFMSLLLEFS